MSPGQSSARKEDSQDWSGGKDWHPSSLEGVQRRSTDRGLRRLPGSIPVLDLLLFIVVAYGFHQGCWIYAVWLSIVKMRLPEWIIVSVLGLVTVPLFGYYVELHPVLPSLAIAINAFRLAVSVYYLPLMGYLEHSLKAHSSANREDTQVMGQQNRHGLHGVQNPIKKDSGGPMCVGLNRGCLYQPEARQIYLNFSDLIELGRFWASGAAKELEAVCVHFMEVELTSLAPQTWRHVSSCVELDNRGRVKGGRVSGTRKRVVDWLCTLDIFKHGIKYTAYLAALEAEIPESSVIEPRVRSLAWGDIVLVKSWIRMLFFALLVVLGLADDGTTAWAPSVSLVLSLVSLIFLFHNIIGIVCLCIGLVAGWVPYPVIALLICCMIELIQRKKHEEQQNRTLEMLIKPKSYVLSNLLQAIHDARIEGQQDLELVCEILKFVSAVAEGSVVKDVMDVVEVARYLHRSVAATIIHRQGGVNGPEHKVGTCSSTLTQRIAAQAGDSRTENRQHGDPMHKGGSHTVSSVIYVEDKLWELKLLIQEQVLKLQEKDLKAAIENTLELDRTNVADLLETVDPTYRRELMEAVDSGGGHNRILRGKVPESDTGQPEDSVEVLTTPTLRGRGRNIDLALKVALNKRIMGRGIHGTVRKGVLEDGTVVAVKLARGDITCVKAVMNELLAFADVPPHPNIVECYGGNLNPRNPTGTVYIVEELMATSLSERIENDDFMKTCTYERLLGIFLDVARGLQHLHNHRVFHYDMKPSNILLDGNMRAKIADFDTCSLKERLTITLSCKGTVAYMAPEVYSSFWGKFRAKGDRIDVYSLGVIMCECIRAGISGVLKDGENDDQPDLEPQNEVAVTTRFEKNWSDRFALPKLCPKEMQALVEYCTSFENEERPTVGEVILRLDAFLEREWASQTPPLAERHFQQCTPVSPKHSASE